MAITWKEEFQNNTGVTALQTNFPTSITEACLKASTKAQWFTEAAANGEDVQIYLDSALTIRMAMELVSWDSVAQTFEIHTLYSSLGTVLNKLYLAVDTAQTAQPLVTAAYGRNAVWPDYEIVSHDGGKTDSTGKTSAQTGTIGIVAGKIGEAADFGDAIPSRYFEYTIAHLTQWSATGWSKILGPVGSSGRTFVEISQNSLNRIICAADESPDDIGIYNTSGGWFRSGVKSSPGTYKKYSFSFDQGVREKIYIDGVLMATTTAAALYSASATTLRIGASVATTAWDLTGQYDEFRLAKFIISDNWDTTEYNNQSSPGTFWVGQGGAVVSSGNAGSGSLQASTAALIGVGTLKQVTSGNIQADPAVAVGVGQINVANDATGSPQAAKSTVSGSGNLKQVVSGAIQAAAATVSGFGSIGSSNIGSGSLQAGSAASAGLGVLTQIINGSPQSLPADLMGTGNLTQIGNGFVQASPATASGSDSLAQPGGMLSKILRPVLRKILQTIIG